MKNQKRHPLLYSEIRRLASAVSAHKPFRIFTFGVYDGLRCGAMMKEAREAGRNNVELYGCDMFETMTPAKNTEEIGKVQLAPSSDQAKMNVRKYGNPNAMTFYKGDSTELLPRIVGNLPPMDIVFIDGGHSLATIQSDTYYALRMLAPHGSILFDDLYPGDMTKGALAQVEVLKKIPGIICLLSEIDVYPELSVQIALIRGAGIRSFARNFDTWLSSKGVVTPTPPVEITVEKEVKPSEDVTVPPVTEEVKVISNDPPASDSDPVVQPVVVREDGNGVSTTNSELPGDSSGRRESRLERELVTVTTEDTGVMPSLFEERPKPDEKLELGTEGSTSTQDTAHSGNEQRREVSNPVVGTNPPRPGSTRPGPSRTSNQRPRPQTPAASEPVPPKPEATE